MAVNNLETPILRNNKVLVILLVDGEKVLDSQEHLSCGQAHEQRSAGQTWAEGTVRSSLR